MESLKDSLKLIDAEIRQHEQQIHLLQKARESLSIALGDEKVSSTTRTSSPKASPEQLRIVYDCLAAGPGNIALISARAGISSRATGAALRQLVEAKTVEALPGGKYGQLTLATGRDQLHAREWVNDEDADKGPGGNYYHSETATK